LDLSFAPVADLERGNLAIGDRAFHADPLICAELTAVYVDTLQRCGMPATLKHFPGHGSVLADTHHDRAIDPRPLPQILDEDVLPFATAIAAGARAVMMAHVEYPQADAHAAGYSRYWIQQVLRAGLGFQGVVISDDIGMVAGAALGAVSARLDAHARAGCDLVLVCDPAQVPAALDAAQQLAWKPSAKLVKLLRGRLRSPLARERERSTWGTRLARLSGLLEWASS
jgi:beta-N-acetylhexosaminidase